jgi:hypothetical protein
MYSILLRYLPPDDDLPIAGDYDGEHLYIEADGWFVPGASESRSNGFDADYLNFMYGFQRRFLEY